jgi:hypothetical protein
MAAKRMSPEVQEQIVAEYRAGKSIYRLARDTGFKPVTVRKKLADAGVRIRPAHRPVRGTALEAAILRLYPKHSQEAIGRRLGVGQAVVSRILRAHGMETNPMAVGKNHGRWKGGRYVSPYGYVLIKTPDDHPFAVMRGANGYTMEHRLVLAETLGRPLLPTEQVHHRDGNKQNNAPENLSLRQRQHGAGQHWRCADCGGRNIVADDGED